jgi:hypothetical protein
MTVTTGTTAQESRAMPASPDVPGGPASSQNRGLVDRLRGLVPWVASLILLLALFSALKWWGDQQQQATRQGRSWPPEPVKVFLGR